MLFGVGRKEDGKVGDVMASARHFEMGRRRGRRTQ